MTDRNDSEQLHLDLNDQNCFLAELYWKTSKNEVTPVKNCVYYIFQSVMDNFLLSAIIGLSLLLTGKEHRSV